MYETNPPWAEPAGVSIGGGRRRLRSAGAGGCSGKPSETVGRKATELRLQEITDGSWTLCPPGCIANCRKRQDAKLGGYGALMRYASPVAGSLCIRYLQSEVKQ